MFAVYAITSPGRFDLIDTQWRYEVASNLLRHGSPHIQDPALLQFGLQAVGSDGRAYSRHSVGGSIAGLPALLLGRLVSGVDSEFERFCYTLANAAYGALTAVVLYGLYRDLGLERARRLRWTLLAAFTSMLWPLSVTSLDNVQQALLMLATIRLGGLALQRQRQAYATWAGLLAGLLVLHQPSFVLVVPTMALSLVGAEGWSRDVRATQQRLARYTIAAATGPLLWIAYNWWRFRSPFGAATEDATSVGHPPLLGNPIIGSLSLLLSPGKSILLFSPTILLGLAGLRTSWRRSRHTCVAIASTCALHFLLIASLSFFGGDWCWGPRYLGCIVVLLSVAAPFGVEAMRPWLSRAILALGLCVQLLAISVDHHVFFMNHRLAPYFWHTETWFYFRESQWLERPREAFNLYWLKKPPSARFFAPSVHRGSPTSAPIGASDPAHLPEAIPLFLVFQVPRPWPFWVPRVARARRPVETTTALLSLVALGALGAVLLRRRADPSEEGEALAAQPPPT